MFETLRWNESLKCLELLDQTKLPHEVEYVCCTSASDVAARIRDMTIRGAPAIGCAAAYGIALEGLHLSGARQLTHFDDDMERAFTCLAASRPTAVNLAWALDRMRNRFANERAPRNDDLTRITTALLDEAHAISAEDVAANRAIGAFGAQFLNDGDAILTHCNAGALATAGHGTALGVIRSAIAQGKQISVFAGETRPWLQGARLTAWELMQDDIPVTLIADSAAGYLMATRAIAAVIVGADRIAANGDTANKIGTYQLAVLAERQDIPFYVAAPTSTVDLSLQSGDQIIIEEREGAELTSFTGHRSAPENVLTWNPVFDVTPAALITAIITENGVSMKGNHSDGLKGLVRR